MSQLLSAENYSRVSRSNAQQREKLHKKFCKKLQINSDLDRKIVSFQANKSDQLHSWMKYREGFSSLLVHYCIADSKFTGGVVLDPFAGSGTTLLEARRMGFDSVGIELLPIGNKII